jgi:hypothetical protein
VFGKSCQITGRTFTLRAPFANCIVVFGAILNYSDYGKRTLNKLEAWPHEL